MIDSTVIVSSVIAVAGTLLGAFVTFVFQRSATREAAKAAFATELRRERLEMFSAFASAAITYRHTELDRWFRRDEEPDGELYRLARAECHRQRAAARDALLRVQLVANDSGLSSIGADAIDACRSIHEAADPSERVRRGDQARSAIDTFVSRAAQDIRMWPPHEAAQLDESAEDNGQHSID